MRHQSSQSDDGDNNRDRFWYSVSLNIRFSSLFVGLKGTELCKYFDFVLPPAKVRVFVSVGSKNDSLHFATCVDEASAMDEGHFIKITVYRLRKEGTIVPLTIQANNATPLSTTNIDDASNTDSNDTNEPPEILCDEAIVWECI